MSNADEHLRLIKNQIRAFPIFANSTNSNNAFNFGAFPEIYDENGNLRDKFRKQIAVFKRLKDLRNGRPKPPTILKG